MTKPFAGLVLLALLSMNACSSATDAEEPSSAAPAAEVSVASNQFTPATVTIKVGQTVRWTWSGGTHNVVSGSDCNTKDGAFESGAPVGSGTFEKKFETAGTFPYYCELHCSMGMKGQVVVQP